MKYDVQVYTSKKTTRLNYAVDLVLGNILGLDYIITSSPKQDTPLINYSSDRSIGGIYIQPEGLLFEEGIRMQDIWIAHLNGIPLFFQQPPEAGFQLDIFSFAFYMVTRYEEYLSKVRDEQGRFAAESSLAYKHNFLDIPVVDIWANRLGITLKLLYPGIKIPEKKYESLLTVDIEEPYAFKGKGIIKNMIGLATDLARRNNPARRLACMTGSSRDIYDTYDYINKCADKYNCPVLYFFTAGKIGMVDKNINPFNRCYKRLIKKLVNKYEIGLRISSGSSNQERFIIKEKERLENITHQQVTRLRNQYNLLSLPDTYQVIQSVGIEKDYTLGFIRELGFRAGIARPFKFYDLSREEITELLVVPFQYMDITLQKYKRYEPSEAMESIKRLVEKTREAGGLFVSVWHNTSLTDKDDWSGWRGVFEFMMKEQQVSSIEKNLADSK